MEKKSFIHIGGIDCPPELEEKFNDWQENVHVPMVMKYKGVKKATHYKVAYEDSETPNYLIAYEFDSKEDYEAWTKSPEMVVARADTAETWKDKKYSLRWRLNYEAIKTWQ